MVLAIYVAFALTDNTPALAIPLQNKGEAMSYHY